MARVRRVALGVVVAVAGTAACGRPAPPASMPPAPPATAPVPLAPPTAPDRDSPAAPAPNADARRDPAPALKPGVVARGGALDMAKMMAESSQAPWQIALHADARVGQWAEWEASGMRMWWGVTGERDGRLVVETRNIMEGMPTTTQAYLVDREGNVSAAWVANRDPAGAAQEGYPQKVMPRPVAAPTADAPGVEQGDETVESAGREWNCKWMQIGASKSWMAADGWFSRLIRSDHDGRTVLRLVAMGTDATLGLRIPD